MRTTNKAVIEKLRNHINENIDQTDLIATLEVLKSERVNTYNAAKEIVEGGTFLVYQYDINNFMNELDINDKHKEYDDLQTWELYKHLLAREISKIYTKATL